MVGEVKATPSTLLHQLTPSCTQMAQVDKGQWQPVTPKAACSGPTRGTAADAAEMHGCLTQAECVMALIPELLHQVVVPPAGLHSGTSEAAGCVRTAGLHQWRVCAA